MDSYQRITISCQHFVETFNKTSFSSCINEFREDILTSDFWISINVDDIISTDYTNMKVKLSGETEYRQFNNIDNLIAHEKVFRRRCILDSVSFKEIQFSISTIISTIPIIDMKNIWTEEEITITWLSLGNVEIVNLFIAERSVIYAQKVINALENKKITLRDKTTITRDDMELVTNIGTEFYGDLIKILEGEIEVFCPVIHEDEILTKVTNFLPFLIAQHFVLVMFTCPKTCLEKHLDNAAVLLTENINRTLAANSDTMIRLREDHRVLLMLHSVIAEIKFSVTLVENFTQLDEDAIVSRRELKRN